MRIGVLADIGQAVYHVGDEAIGHAIAHDMQIRGHEPVLFTRDPAHTRLWMSERFATAPSMAFPWDPDERQSLVEDLRTALAAGDAYGWGMRNGFAETVRAIRELDAMHIGGGGNLNSQYGWLLSERIATALIALHFGKRVTLGGQTLGPALNERDRADIAQVLPLLSHVSFRDYASVQLARDLAPEVAPSLSLDDATYVDLAGDGSDPDRRPKLVATFSSDLEERAGHRIIPALAQFLIRLSKHANAPVTFVPHMATPGEGDGDEEVHRRIAAEMTAGTAELMTITDAVTSARILSDAEFVVTSRFHPAVFGLRHGAAVLALASTGYAYARMEGVMQNWGVDGYVLPAPALLSHESARLTDAMTRDQADYRRHLSGLKETAWARSRNDRDRLLAAVDGHSGTSEHLENEIVGHSAPPELLEVRDGHMPFMRRSAQSEQAEVDRDYFRSLAAAADREITAYRSSRTYRSLNLLHRGRGRLLGR